MCNMSPQRVLKSDFDVPASPQVEQIQKKKTVSQEV